MSWSYGILFYIYGTSYSLVSSINKKLTGGTYLVVQWLRIRLPMQQTRVRSLVREDPTCHGATKPVSHNY